MSGLPQTNSGFGGITQALASGMLPSIGSMTGSISNMLGSLGSIGSLKSLPAGVEPPQAEEAVQTAVTTATTIQTEQAAQFTAAAAAKPVAANPALMARLMQKRKQQAGKAARPAAAALAVKKTVEKPSKAKAAAARASAGGADEKKVQVGPWSAEEINQLKKLVEEHGATDWQQVRFFSHFLSLISLTFLTFSLSVLSHFSRFSEGGCDEHGAYGQGRPHALAAGVRAHHRHAARPAEHPGRGDVDRSGPPADDHGDQWPPAAGAHGVARCGVWLEQRAQGRLSGLGGESARSAAQVQEGLCDPTNAKCSGFESTDSCYYRYAFPIIP